MKTKKPRRKAKLTANEIGMIMQLFNERLDYCEMRREDAADGKKNRDYFSVQFRKFSKLQSKLARMGIEGTI